MHIDIDELINIEVVVRWDIKERDCTLSEGLLPKYGVRGNAICLTANSWQFVSSALRSQGHRFGASASAGHSKCPSRSLGHSDGSSTDHSFMVPRAPSNVLSRPSPCSSRANLVPRLFLCYDIGNTTLRPIPIYGCVDSCIQAPLSCAMATSAQEGSSSRTLFCWPSHLQNADRSCTSYHPRPHSGSQSPVSLTWTHLNQSGCCVQSVSCDCTSGGDSVCLCIGIQLIETL